MRSDKVKEVSRIGLRYAIDRTGTRTRRGKREDSGNGISRRYASVRNGRVAGEEFAWRDGRTHKAIESRAYSGSREHLRAFPSSLRAISFGERSRIRAIGDGEVY